MSWNRKLYTDNWDAIALNIKEEVHWTCEGCGKVCRRSGDAIAEFAKRAKVPLPEVPAHPKCYDLGQMPRKQIKDSVDFQEKVKESCG